MINNILIPVDGSACSDRAVAKSISIAELYNAKLNFLYVASINQMAINSYLADAVLTAVRKAGDVILNRAVNMVHGDIQYETFSEVGSPAVTIIDFEKRLQPDLIVMGSRGLGLVQGVLLGSVSQFIVEQASCSVLVVK